MNIYRNYIGGTWAESSSSRQIPNLNPANTDEVLGNLRLSTAEEASAAAACAAQASAEWRRTPPPRRGAIVSRAARLLEERRDTLAQTLTREEGKLLSEAQGELTRSINVAEFSAAQGRRLMGRTIPLDLPANLGYTVRQPVGPVALITPWNFPVAIPVWKIAPALVSGNTVVFKPSPLTPETSELVVQCFIDAGLPPGVLNLVHGDEVAASALIDSPAIRAVSFTGATSTGRSIYERAARRGIRVQCEMGGKNPVVVLEDANIDLAVSGVLAGAFGSTGQRCTATSRVILAHPVADAFLERLVQVACGMRLGDGLQPDVQMGPLVSEQQLARVLGAIERGKAEGAELLCGGQRADEGDLGRGFFVQPTVFDRVRPEMRLAHEEIFGPVLAVFRVENFEEALAIANDSEFGLTSSIYTHDTARMFRFIDEIQTGMTHVNSPTLGGEAQVPFGGTKSSAIGPFEAGDEAFDFYTETKVVYIDYSGGERGKLY